LSIKYTCNVNPEVSTTEIDDEYYQTNDSYGESFWWVIYGDIR